MFLAARSLGFVATTPPQGADRHGSKWPGLVKKYAIHEPLKDRVVWIIPDNDEPGQSHARAVADTLHGFAKSVKILNLPNLPEGGDLSDFLEKEGREGTYYTLLYLAEETPEYEFVSAIRAERRRQAQEKGKSDSHHLSDMGNAERLAAAVQGKIKFCGQLGGWYHYDGTRWAQDQLSRVQAAAKDVVRGLHGEAANLTDKDQQEALTKFARKCESVSKINAMIQLLPSEQEISVLPDVFDTNPLLLNVRNGTVDLASGELRPHSPNDLITRVAPVDYDAAAVCPRWDQFITEITEGDAELTAYMQRVLGYALTGLTTEQCWFFLWGKGSNGKSVLVNTISAVLGDYAIDTPAATFMERRNDDSPRNDLARLRGARFVSASEPKGKRFDAETIKKVSGDGKVTARFLRREFFEFTPEAKVFICANNRPEVRDASEAFWRRPQLIPFTRQFEGEDKDVTLGDKLKAEAPGILNWMLTGLRQWQQSGLNPPEKVKLAVADYRQDADKLGDFLDKHCVVHISATVPVSELYKAYQSHCEDVREQPLKRAPFNENLLGRAGIIKGKVGPASARVKVWRGIGLRAEGQADNVVPGNFGKQSLACSQCDLEWCCPKPVERRDATSCAQFKSAQG